MSFYKEEEPEDFEKMFGRGTTIISHTQGHTICIVSDGRRCSDFESKEGLLVLQGNDKKIYKIDEDLKICCSTAGNVALGNHLLDLTKKEAQSSGDAHKIMTELQSYRKELMKEKVKKMRRGKRREMERPMFEAEFTVYSLDGKGAPLIQLIGPTENTDACKNEGLVVSGSGGEAARAHFKKLVAKRFPRTSAERMAYLKASVAATCLKDIHTGGFVEEATLSPQGLTIENQRDHVIKVIADHFQHVADELNNKLLCITRHFPYSLENEEAVTTFIKRQIPSVGRKLILGVHGEVIVRCLEFPDADIARRALEKIGGRELQLNLKPRVFHPVEIKRPIQSEFRNLAVIFVDSNDF